MATLKSSIGSRMAEERERLRLSPESVAQSLGVSVQEYYQIEAGASPMEHWLPILGHIAVRTGKPTSRFISPATGKASDAKEGTVGPTVKAVREVSGASQQNVLEGLGGAVTQDHLSLIESGRSGLERYSILLLSFSNLTNVPIFNFIMNAPLKQE
eukprot:PhF_6_TR28855/c0_g1_i1/m.42208